MRDVRGLSAPELLEMMVSETASLEERDEALYYAISERLAPSLRRKFAPFEEAFFEGFEDVLMDYFLYLRGEDAEPYGKLRSIRNPASFDAWLVVTFRNFLCRKASGKCRVSKIDLRPELLGTEDIDKLSEEDLVGMLSTLVAYCCQEFTPVRRFVFLRMVLTLLDKGLSLPDKDMAEAMGLTCVCYRVTGHRVRREVSEIRDLILSGAQLELLPDSRLLADDLSGDFSDWYRRISECYDETLGSLEQSDAVWALRKERTSAGSALLHNGPQPGYGSSRI